MAKELRLLLEATSPSANMDDYRNAIVEENALAKPSMQTRRKSFSYLRDRYGLDPSIPLFRVLRALCDAEPDAMPLLAMLVAVARDPILRASAPAVATATVGSPLASRDIAAMIEHEFPESLTAKTRESTSENAMATWIQAGLYRKGRTQHTRQVVTPSPASTTMALLLGTLSDVSGEQLLTTTWAHLIDGTPQVLLGLARESAQRGWLEFRHAGGVLDITFRQFAPELEGGVT